MNHKVNRQIYISYVFITLFAIFLPMGSFAKDNLHSTILQITGEKFHETCKSSDTLDIGICLGYTMGLSDGIAILQIRNIDRLHICIPRLVNVGQRRDVIVDHISKNPANRHEPISIIAIEAWRNAWPCN